ncbi:MAG: N-acetylmuramoyl-L-alanine amidase [Thiomicrorhabdus sp.]|nr:MAG: N-acetylmuramoyl-L-alanine amidase [Thiomicrorhabdus sp.]
MKLCALVIGHKKTSPGASNKASALSEFEFNDALAQQIEESAGTVHVQRVYRRTYNSLPEDLNQLAPDFIISLHCNAFNEQASGTETLYYHRSVKGKLIAEILNNNLVDALGLKDRGIKPKSAEDRGGFLLKTTQAPCIIAEPFFIDNDTDLATAESNRNQLVQAYISSIETIAEVI